VSRLRRKVKVQEGRLRLLGRDAFVGTGQVAEIMGIVKSNVGRMRRSGEIPEPYQELPSGPIWLRSAVELAAEEWRARRAERGEADG
jgi:hypothetical protein